MTKPLKDHSDLGASGMERWQHCPGSVALLRELELPESDEPDYRADGSCAHAANAWCLEGGHDAWEAVNETFHNRVVTAEMAEAMQVYLDECRQYMGEGWTWGVEYRFHEPSIHKDFYGTTDFWAISPDQMTLIVRDYKHGEGIVVEVIGNPQVRYYALGRLLNAPDVGIVDVGIVQPRAFHVDGPIRTERLTTDDIGEWCEAVLLPAMARTELDYSLDAGEWCRFCPAKLVCPLLTSLFGAAAKSDPKHVVNFNDEALGRDYQYVQAVKFYLKALEDEAFRRLNQGRKVPNTKLVYKKANRVFKDGAKEFFQNAYGAKAMTPPELRSPAQMAELGPRATAQVTEWAYTPQTGLTVALTNDSRPEVIVEPAKEVFKEYLDSQRAED